jgi:hypothetical protein
VDLDHQRAGQRHDRIDRARRCIREP